MSETISLNKYCQSPNRVTCLISCAKWSTDFQIKDKNISQYTKISSQAITTRNFKESFCKLLMINNNLNDSINFNFLKENHGSPFINDIEMMMPTIPIDQNNVNVNTLGPEFFTFFLEIDLKENKDPLKAIRKINSNYDRRDYEIFINVIILIYMS
jgi:hypothetical protein